VGVFEASAELIADAQHVVGPMYWLTM